MVPGASAAPSPAHGGAATDTLAPVARVAGTARCAVGLGALAVSLAGCIASSTVDDPQQPAVDFTPIVIPLPEAPAGTDRTVGEFYESILARLQAAHQDGDLPTLRALVATFLRDDAPEWARQRLLGFRALQKGLQFEQAAAGSARLEAVAVDADAGAAAAEDIGSALEYELVFSAPPGGPWRLGGRDDADPVAFRFAIQVRDHFVDGSARGHEDGEIVRLDRAVELDGEPLRLPVRLDLGDSSAVRREVSLRIELLPGYVQQGEDRAPVRTTQLAAIQATQWPPGHAAVRKAPLQTLRTAQQLGDPAHFAHVRLAAEFAAAQDREAVEIALIDWVRLGRPDQALVAMAALRSITRADLPVGDRDAWLAWWQARR